MTLRRAVRAALCCLMVSAAAWAASISEIERQLRAATVGRALAQKQRADRMAEAATLADVIAAEEDGSLGRTRASAELGGLLRRFDRLVSQLDESDRTIKGADVAILQLRQVFLAAFEAERRQLGALTDLRSAAARSTELEAVRRRVDEMTASDATFRPLLVVSLSPADTVDDLDQKLAVLAAERLRAVDAVAATDRELSVLGGRAVVTRRILAGLEDAARRAPQDLRLVQRQVDEVQNGLRDIQSRQTEVGGVRDTIVSGLADLEKRVTECETRRRLLIRLPSGGQK